jgi:hypothetical protein
MENRFNLEEIEQYGAMDYYLELKSYINRFVNSKYSLNKEVFSDIVNNKFNEIIEARQIAINVMLDELKIIIDEVINDNKIFLAKLYSGDKVIAETRDDYKKRVLVYEKRLLESIYSMEKANSK